MLRRCVSSEQSDVQRKSTRKGSRERGKSAFAVSDTKSSVVFVPKVL